MVSPAMLSAAEELGPINEIEKGNALAEVTRNFTWPVNEPTKNVVSSFQYMWSKVFNSRGVKNLMY